MNLYDEFFEVINALQSAKMRFAVVGGLALAFYDEPRFTRDIDLLVHSEDEQLIPDAMTAIGYAETAQPWTFESIPILLRRFMKIEGEDFIEVDFLIGRQKQIDEIVYNAVEQPWSGGKVNVVSKADLIWLKKHRGSDQDKLDIQKLKNDEA